VCGACVVRAWCVCGACVRGACVVRVQDTVTCTSKGECLGDGCSMRKGMHGVATRMVCMACWPMQHGSPCCSTHLRAAVPRNHVAFVHAAPRAAVDEEKRAGQKNEMSSGVISRRGPSSRRHAHCSYLRAGQPQSSAESRGKRGNAWRTILVVAARIFGEEISRPRGTLRLGRSVYYLR